MAKDDKSHYNIEIMKTSFIQGKALVMILKNFNN